MSREIPPEPDHTPDHAAPAGPPALSQLLRRRDLWRGHSQKFTEQASWSTGYAGLDQALLHSGWPLSTLVEVCQPQPCQAEWLLLAPAIQRACAKGYAILLNPPTEPYVPGLVQQKIDLDQLIVVEAASPSDFVASLIDILRSPACQLLLGWEPARSLSYAELRKCQLATAEHSGLCVLFRTLRQQQQSSPASLRLSTQLCTHTLELQLFKQRGKLHNTPVHIPLSEHWQSLPLHCHLGHPHLDHLHRGKSAQPQHSAKLLTFAHHSADS